MAARSKMDPMLDKAKPTSVGGSASVISYLRRGGEKITQWQFHPERGVRICQKNNSAGTKVSEEGMKKVLQVFEQSKEVNTGRYPPAAYGGPCTEASVCLKEALTLWEAHTGAAPWQDLRTSGEKIPLCSRFAGKTCDLAGDPHWSTLFLKCYIP